MQTPNPRRRPKGRKHLSNEFLLMLAVALFLVLAILVCVALFAGKDGSPEESRPSMETTGTQTTEPDGTTDGSTTEPTTQPQETTEPPVQKESSFTLSATGDLIGHVPVYAYDAKATNYKDFQKTFQYFADYVTGADYAVINLETTLAGDDNGYSFGGYPQFNSPDFFVDVAKNTGFDMMLTANNHTYDTRTTGLTRTVDVLMEYQMDYLGTKDNAEDPDYLIVQRNNIAVGMMCYTYDTDNDPDKVALNGIPVKDADKPYINSFDYANLDLFYEEIRENMRLMKEDGAEVTVVFLHWGIEYSTKPNADQKTIAQNLCDLGVDVIIGGHPHVVQPMELLTSTTDEDHKTVCLYSMGNSLSNQQQSEMNHSTAHTEDGLLFSVTFCKYTDGTVLVEAVEILPTWVYRYSDKSVAAARWPYGYYILPLDKQIEDWQTQFGISESVCKMAEASYDRTMALVGSGLAEVNEYLAQTVAETEAALGVK